MVRRPVERLNRTDGTVVSPFAGCGDDALVLGRPADVGGDLLQPGAVAGQHPADDLDRRQRAALVAVAAGAGKHQVRINGELMDEVDGPMLRPGLQEMDGHRITLPGRRVDRPWKERLAERFEEFRAAG